MKILIPTDFSELSNYALNLALKVAESESSELHLIHVIQLPAGVLLQENGELLMNDENDITLPLLKKDEALAKIQNYVKDIQLPVVTKVCYGHLNQEVLRYAEKENIGLIVMGTHGATGVKELISGSHTEYVAMRAKAPVLSLKCDRSDMSISSIVLAGDFSKEDIPHCETVIKLQKAFNAQLHLLRVNTPSKFLPDNEVKNNMKAFAEKHGLQNYVTSVYSHNDVEEGIMYYAEENNADIVSIGTKGRTGFNKLINGCVSADLINHVFRPILTFNLNN
jgi:nucleotide-binding universal stress UspA family protein